jgi:cytochrome c oxidase subunit 2
MKLGYRVLLIAAGLVLVAPLVLAPLSCQNKPAAGPAEKDAGKEGAGGEASKKDDPPADNTPSGTVENGVRVIQMTAKRFEFNPSRVVVNQGDKVRLEVTALDRSHGFRLIEYGLDAVLEPKKVTTIEFAADKPGAFEWHCSVFCGAGHDKMKGELVVLPKK